MKPVLHNDAYCHRPDGVLSDAPVTGVARCCDGRVILKRWDLPPNYTYASNIQRSDGQDIPIPHPCGHVIVGGQQYVLEPAVGVVERQRGYCSPTMIMPGDWTLGPTGPQGVQRYGITINGGYYSRMAYRLTGDLPFALSADPEVPLSAERWLIVLDGTCTVHGKKQTAITEIKVGMRRTVNMAARDSVVMEFYLAPEA